MKYALIAALWCAAGGYVLFSAMRVREHRALQQVERIEIGIRDSTAHGQLVTRRMVDEWVRGSGMKTLGAPVGEVDLAGLEALIERNGFVDRVRASVTYAGLLRIDVSQRRPLFRLLVDAYNVYVTDEGYVFRAPQSSSIYVPVVTGSYRPPFAADWEGTLEACRKHAAEESEARIEAIEREKYPLFRRERKNDERWRSLRRMRTSKRFLESDESFARRVKELRAEKERIRRSCRWEEREVERALAALDGKQEAERRRQKNREKRIEDFSKLITFVEQIGEDDFWSSEIVQIVASTAPSGSLEVEIVPRSGSFTVRLGRLERIDEKLGALRTFYRGALGNVGWESYRRVNVQYEGQIVCTK